MPQLKDGYRGAAILLGLHADLLFFVTTLVAALLAASYLASL